MLVNNHFQKCSKVTFTDYDETIYIKFTTGLGVRLRRQNSLQL